MNLANDKDYSVRSGVAENLNTHEKTEILSKLANDEEREVRFKLACNKNMPKEILSKLAKDIEPIVRRTVVKKSNTPIEVLSEPEEDEDNFVKIWAKETKGSYYLAK